MIISVDRSPIKQPDVVPDFSEACIDSKLPCTPQVSHAIRDSLLLRAADFGIVLEDIAITHLSFGSEFTKAVEMKQVAEQEAERARFVVLKAEQVR